MNSAKEAFNMFGFACSKKIAKHDKAILLTILFLKFNLLKNINNAKAEITIKGFTYEYINALTTSTPKRVKI